jgi:hypothetical protein
MARALLGGKAPLARAVREMFLRLAVLAVATAAMLVARLRIMGSTLPVFTK